MKNTWRVLKEIEANDGTLPPARERSLTFLYGKDVVYAAFAAYLRISDLEHSDVSNDPRIPHE